MEFLFKIKFNIICNFEFYCWEIEVQPYYNTILTNI